MAWFWPPLIVVGCLAALALTVYILYLDHRIREQFQGARWSLPAKVYARPLELYPGERISEAGLVSELKRLGYSAEVSERPGSYAQTKDGVQLISRAFTFWDGEQQPRSITVRFEGGVIASLTNRADGEAVALARLDPLLLGSLFQIVGEDRILLQIDEVPKLVSEGLIAVEDREFYDHLGIDPKAILRASIANAKAGHVVQGGSTITQQLVKNFFLNRRQTLTRKAREAIMALLLESHFSKKEILEAYLNEVYLGQDGSRAIHGFGLASHFYFLRPLAELKVQEIALLVALVRGPSYYDPRRHPDRALQRRDLVLQEFAQAGVIDQATLTASLNTPLGVTKRPPSGTTQFPAFVDLVRRQLRGQYREADLASEGLRIFTTLDPRTQELTEAELTQSLKQLEAGHGMRKGTLQGAVVVTSVEGGEVLALVGDRRASFSGFNRALDAKRPIGSLVKPMVYLTALAEPNRYTLVSHLQDVPLELPQPGDKIWSPQNYDKEEHGDDVPLYKSLANSYNLSTVRLALDVTPKAIANTIQTLGFKGSPMAVPSIALGTVEMAPMEVAQVYNTMAAGGYYTPLLAIREVTSRDGQPLSRYALQLRRVYDENAVFLLNWAMQRVMSEGTGRYAYTQLPAELNLAGKTGTTDDMRDSWFAGYAGNRLSVVWVGRDDFKPGRLTGSTGALRVWTDIMKGLPLEPLNPAKPENIEYIPLDPNNVDHDDDDCDTVIQVPFVQGSLPSDMEPCDSIGRPDDDIVPPSNDRQPQRRQSPGDWFFDLFR